ncbi:tyrosine-type recombinase/integrase [Altererythrobacter aerius]|uniref:Tyrosine-type recombinase/integrase n=1 Tax=Tsuneonella aeria TaxID=1837929 RepID=A0A6I4TCN5_9SPHN|nr:site-specific integrase [Tsuneonella aeria]MXO74823.1 tyrosine-type recombinase/integrase [Tsuneonella aeria]
MAKLKLTSAFCREVTCAPHKRKEVYRCTEQTGFGLEVRPNGKTFWVYYTTPDGKAAQIKIGGYADIPFDLAKRTAKELRSKIVLGHDPAQEKANRKAVITFSELARMHVEHAKGHLRSHGCVELAHRRYLVPRFGKLRIDQVTTPAIENYLAELRQRLAPASVDRLRLVMHRSYRLAQAWNLPGADRNPVSSVVRPKYDNKRTCLLSPTEVERLLEACEQSANGLLKPIVQLALATAARKSELLKAEWKHIDFVRSEWLIPLTKNGHPRRVPLSSAAMAVIHKLPRSGEPWLLANPATGKPYDNIKRAWKTACRAAGLPDLHFHDLRHAGIGAMINNGVSLHVAGKVAGHLRPESTARYAFVSDKSLAAAVEAGAHNLQL